MSYRKHLPAYARPRCGRIHFETAITYHDMEFDFSGEWTPYVPATFSQPEEGGCFDEYEIKHDGILIDEILTEKAIDHIVDRASERFIDENGR